MIDQILPKKTFLMNKQIGTKLRMMFGRRKIQESNFFI